MYEQAKIFKYDEKKSDFICTILIGVLCVMFQRNNL